MGFKRRKGREEEEEEEEAGNEDLTPTIRSLWWSVMWKGVSGSRCAPRHACSYIFASVSMKYWHYKEWEGDYKAPPPIPLSFHSSLIRSLYSLWMRQPTHPNNQPHLNPDAGRANHRPQHFTYLSKGKSVHFLPPYFDKGGADLYPLQSAPFTSFL